MREGGREGERKVESEGEGGCVPERGGGIQKGVQRVIQCEGKRDLWRYCLDLREISEISGDFTSIQERSKISKEEIGERGKGKVEEVGKVERQRDSARDTGKGQRRRRKRRGI